MTEVEAVPRRGRPRDEAIDAAILDAAIDQLIGHGLGGLSMEAVAAQAGVAKTTVYRRWSNIDDLSLAAIGRIKGDAVEPPAGSVRDQLVFLVAQLHRSWSDDRFAAVMRRVAAEGTFRPDHYRQARDRLIGPHIRIMREVLEGGVDTGVISAEVDLEVLRRLFVSPVTASAFSLQPMPPLAEVVAGIDVVLHGAAP